MKRLRDPIFGEVYQYVETASKVLKDDSLLELIEEVIFSEAVIRLNDIKQLSFAYYTHTGGTHTRFSHSIGTMCVMLEILTKIKGCLEEYLNFDKNDFRTVILATLLHDIGHGPFSHGLDCFYNRCKFHYRSFLSTIPYITGHDYFTKRFIEEGRWGLKEIFDRYGINSKQVAGLASGNPSEEKYRVLLPLIDDIMDVDRIDFVLRDSYFTGHPLPNEISNKKCPEIIEGIAKSIQLISKDNITRLVEEPDEDLSHRICYSKEGFEKYIVPMIELYTDMYLDVYLNEYNRVAQEIVGKALFISFLYGEVYDLEHVYSLKDSELITLLENSSYKEVRDLMEKLRMGRLPKKVCEFESPKVVPNYVSLEEELEKEFQQDIIVELFAGKQIRGNVCICTSECRLSSITDKVPRRIKDKVNEFKKANYKIRIFVENPQEIDKEKMKRIIKNQISEDTCIRFAPPG